MSVLDVVIVFFWILDKILVGGVLQTLDQKMKNGYRTSIDFHQGGPNPCRLQVGMAESFFEKKKQMSNWWICGIDPRSDK